MATESPLRMLDSGGTRKKPSPKDTAVYRPTVQNKEAEELGVLLKGHRFHVDQKDAIPDRSGSAPPSIEGSVAAFRNILAQTNLSSISSLENLNFESEEHMRSDPAYSAYYSSNVNLNPRLPKPLISRENPRLVHQIGSFGNNWKSASLDDSGNKPSQFTRGSLSTHKEEPEDDRSPREASEAENGTLIDSEQNISSLSGRHKSLVDLIQEDFPRTPSPVYSQSRSSSHAADEAIDHDVHSISSNVSAINISKLPESDSASSDVCVDTYGLEESAMRLISNNDPSTASSRDSPGLDGTQNLQKDESRANDSGSDADAAAKGSLQSRTKNKQEDQQCQGRNLVSVLQYHPSPQGIPHPVQGIQAQMIPQGAQGVNQPHSSVGKISHPHPKVSLEVQTPMHPPAHNPTLYASPAYMTAGASFYPNYQPSGLYSPQYSVGGYAYGSAFLPPYVTSYQSQGVPVPFGASPGLSFDGRAAGASAGENIPHAAGLQHLGKFYGQHGLMLQPSFVDPLPMQYFQHPFGDAYGATVQQQIDSFSPQKDPAIAAYIGDQKLQPPTNGGMGISSPGKVGIAAGGYYGGPPSMGMMTQFPPSPLASPVVPSSPVAGINHLVQRNDMRSPQGLSRNAGPYSGGQGQRGANSFDDPKRQYFLEELKSNNARKFELSDIAGRIVEFSVDQHGSRFIQQKLEHCSIEEKVAVFKEVLPHAPKLMTDVFGNYVIQKFFEHGSPEQRKELAGKLAGQMLVLSLQMYGCRVVQKALDVIELEQKIRLVQELDGHVMRCVRDQNGNHVIQKCIECVPTENIEFIISAFRDQVASLSTHPYGCRVIQRVLEHCSDDVQSQCIVDEILESAYLLAQDQYGNYVTQHVLERGKPSERSQIISKLTGRIVQLSQHKYASNVVEKCLEHGDTAEREMLIEEIIGQSEDNDNLLMMMKDQFANYVVQKILETCTEKQQQILLGRIRAHINALKKYTYGKHIVARFEQLCGEESQASES